MKIGTTVCLKSNPKTTMTIEEIENDLVVCVWLNSDSEVVREVFNVNMLEETNPHAFSIAEMITESILNFIEWSYFS